MRFWVSRRLRVIIFGADDLESLHSPLSNILLTKATANIEMSKRNATELQTDTAAHGNETKRPFRPESKDAQDDGMGEFEDGWEDEYESDEEIVDGQGEDGTSSGSECLS